MGNLRERFQKLFRGNTRSYGRYTPKNDKLITIHSSPESDEFIDHLNGHSGLAIVPIQDNGTCYFGAIDVDAHGDVPDIDLIALFGEVEEHMIYRNLVDHTYDQTFILLGA